MPDVPAIKTKRDAHNEDDESMVTVSSTMNKEKKEEADMEHSSSQRSPQHLAQVPHTPQGNVANASEEK